MNIKKKSSWHQRPQQKQLSKIVIITAAQIQANNCHKLWQFAAWLMSVCGSPPDKTSGMPVGQMRDYLR